MYNIKMQLTSKRQALGKLMDKCNDCTSPPTARKQNRNGWCQKNCSFPKQMLAIMSDIEKLQAEKRANRGVLIETNEEPAHV